MQFSGLKFTEEVKSTLQSTDEMPPPQKRLVETVLTLPGTTLEEEFARRNAANNAVAAYCRFEEGGSLRGRKPTIKDSLVCFRAVLRRLGLLRHRVQGHYSLVETFLEPWEVKCLPFVVRLPRGKVSAKHDPWRFPNFDFSSLYYNF